MPSGTGVSQDVSCIQVQSVWKVFGPDPEPVFDPAYADRDRGFFQDQFGLVVGLQNVSFDVQKGNIFVIMGLSGSGKSTMVRCLIRLIEPTAGTVTIDGTDVTAMSDRELIEFRRHKLAMVFQHYGLLPHRTVLDNAAWGLEVQGIKKSRRYARAREILSLVGLDSWEDAYPSQLSGGMQQRVGLARALAVDTDILLMDEPFSGLDPLIRRQMQDELLYLQTELQKTIVFITHDLAEALKLGDQIVILHDGRVAQTGIPEDIVLRPANRYVSDFTQDVRLESILTADTVMVKPGVTVKTAQSPDIALNTIEQSDRNTAWLVDRQGRYIGMVSIASAQRALKAGVEQFGHAHEFVHQDGPCVAPDDTLDALIPQILGHDLPLPVVDGNQKLIGEVHRNNLAEILAQPAPEEDEAQMAEAHAEVARGGP